MFLFDTGPLLCFASTPTGPQLLADRYAGNTAIATDIDRELRGLTNDRVPPVAKAAKNAKRGHLHQEEAAGHGVSSVLSPSVSALLISRRKQRISIG